MFFLKKIISRFHKKDGIFYIKIKKLLGFSPKNINFYEEAFTHSSLRKDNGSRINYERLEFLGDAILGAVVAHFVFLQSPEQEEGYLTKMRTRMVRREYLNQIGEKLKLDSFLILDKKSSPLGGNINGNLFEALIGAIYLDQGYEVVSSFIHRILISSNLDIKELEDKIISYKSLMVEWAQKYKKTITFETDEDVNYKSRKKVFLAKVIIDNKIFSKAHETSKKKAEERAAKRAYYRVKEKTNKS